MTGVYKLSKEESSAYSQAYKPANPAFDIGTPVHFEKVKFKLQTAYVNAFTVGNQVLVFGGGESASSTLHVMNNIDIGFKEVTLSTSPRTLHASCLFNEYYVVHGGTSAGFMNFKKGLFPGSSLIVINPTTGVVNEHVLTGQVPTPRASHRIVQLNSSSILLAGGIDGEEASLGDAYVINMVTFQSVRVADMPMHMVAGVLVNVDGQIIAFGGNGEHGNFNKDMLLFNVDSATWSRFSFVPFEPRKSSAYTVYNGIVFCFGGRNTVKEFSSVWAFSPRLMDWTRMNIAGKTPKLFGAIIFFYHGMLYVAGGSARRPKASDVYRFDTRHLFSSPF